MNIALIVPSLAQYGPVIVANDLSKEFIRMGHCCTVFYFDTKNSSLLWKCQTIKISESATFKFSDYDVVHSHGYRPDRYVSRFRSEMKAANCKLITTQHNAIDFKSLTLSYSIPKAFIGALLWNRTLSSFDNIVFLNQETQNKIKRQIKGKSSVIFNGRNITFDTNVIDYADLEKLSLLQQDYKIIGTCCRFTKLKGIEQIIAALRYLPKYAFIGIGDGSEVKNLMRLARKNGVEKRVEFLGFRSNCTNYIPLFDIYIMCSRSEGFPLALIEAAAAGKPTILSNINIFKSIASSKEVTFYQLDNIESLVNAVKYTALNAPQLSKNILSYYTKKLTAEKMAYKYLEIYTY